MLLYMVRGIQSMFIYSMSLYMSQKTWAYGIWYKVTKSMFIQCCFTHDDVIKWKHFPRYWTFVRGIPRSPVNSPHKGQWRRALMFSLICDWINGWVNTREAGDLRRHRAHYDVTVMGCQKTWAVDKIHTTYVTVCLSIKCCYIAVKRHGHAVC